MFTAPIADNVHEREDFFSVVMIVKVQEGGDDVAPALIMDGINQWDSGKENTQLCNPNICLSVTDGKFIQEKIHQNKILHFTQSSVILFKPSKWLTSHTAASFLGPRISSYVSAKHNKFV